MPPGDETRGPMHEDVAYNWYHLANPDDVTLMEVLELGYQRSSRTDVHELR